MISDRLNFRGRTVLHIGAGSPCPEVNVYLSGGAKRVILVDADPLVSRELNNFYSIKDKVTVYNLAVSNHSGDAKFNRLSLKRLSSLNPPARLYDLFPGLKHVESVVVETRDICDLIDDVVGSDDNLVLVIEAPGEDYRIVESLKNKNKMHQFSDIYIQCARHVLYEQGATCKDVVTLLESSAFDCIDMETGDPDFPALHAQLDVFAYEKRFIAPQIQTLKDRNANLASRFEQKCTELAKKQKLADRYRTRNQNLRKKSEQALEELDGRHQDAQKKMASEHASLIKNVENRHKQEQINLIHKSSLSLKSLEDQNRELQSQIFDIQKQKTNLELAHVTEIKSNETKYKQEESFLIESNAKTVKSLEDQNQRLNSQLLEFEEKNKSALDHYAQREDIDSQMKKLKKDLAERDASMAWLRNKHKQDLADLGQEFSAQTHEDTNAPRVIVVASVPRSGGTWLFNAARLILKNNGHDIIGAWHDDYVPDKSIPYHIVKIHAADAPLPSPWRVFTSHRELTQRMASLVRMGWIKKDPNSIIKAAKGHTDLYNYWNSKTDMEYEFSSIIEDPELVIVNMAGILGLKISSADAKAIARQLDTMQSPESGSPDPVTLLHPGHRNTAKSSSKDSLKRIQAILGNDFQDR